MPVNNNLAGILPAEEGFGLGYVHPSPVVLPGAPYPYTSDGYEQVLAEKRAAEQREERMWRQRYAESAFDNAAKSPAGAVGAFQIMPITYKDYLERGKGKPGDLTDPAYNRKVRDFALGIIQRDLGSLWSKESPEDINLAKRYAAYNWGSGSLRSYLRKKQKEGIDIHNSLDWMAGLPKETRDYVNFIVFNQDVPDTSKVADLYQAARDKYNSMAFGGVLGRFNHSDIRSALDKMRQKGANKYDGDSELTGQMMLIGEDGNPIDVLPGAVSTFNILSDYNRRQVKRLARNDYANVGEETREFDKDWQTKVYNRAWDRADRKYRNQENRKALRRAAIQELQTGVPTGAFNEYTKEGIEDMSPFAMGLVLSAAGPALGGLRTVGDMAKAAGKVAGVAGRGAAKGLEWIGEKAMPSALMKGAASYLPDVAGEVATMAPYADAAALSYWSALAGNTAYNAIRNKDWGTASASGTMALLPLIEPTSRFVAYTVPKSMRELQDWSNFVIGGDTSPYIFLQQRKSDTLAEAEDILSRYGKLPDYLVRAKVPMESVETTRRIPSGGSSMDVENLQFVSPETGAITIPRIVENIGADSGETRYIIDYEIPIRRGVVNPRRIDETTPPMHIVFDTKAAKSSSNELFPDSEYFELRGDKTTSYLPYPESISSEPVENLPVSKMGALEAHITGTKETTPGHTLLVQAPAKAEDAAQIAKNYNAIRSVVGEDAIVAGSGTMYEKGLLSGTPGDVELITTESRASEVARKIGFKQDGKNTFDVRGTSSKAHSAGDVDIQIIEESVFDGSAQGKLAWEMFRTMHPDECAVQAASSVDNGIDFTIMSPINPRTGKAYTAEELYQEFRQGNWSLQNTINDALSVVKDITTAGSSRNNMLKQNRPMALLTHKDPEVKAMVAKAIDTIGRSQVGPDFKLGSSYFKGIDFTNVAENEKFLAELGLKKDFAKDPETMRNLFDYWYMQQSVSKRGVKDAKNLREARIFIGSGTVPRDGGDYSGAGRNAVGATQKQMPFRYPQVGAFQTHITRNPEKYASVNDVMQQAKRIRGHSELTENVRNTAKNLWDNNKSAYETWIRDVEGEDPSVIIPIIEKYLFGNKQSTVSELSHDIAGVVRELKGNGVPADKLDHIVEGIGTLYDLPFVSDYSTGYELYRGIMRNSSDALGVRYFDFYRHKDNERPFEFGRDVEKYAKTTNGGREFYQATLSDMHPDDRILAEKLINARNNSSALGDTANEIEMQVTDNREQARTLLNQALENRGEQADLERQIKKMEKTPGYKWRIEHNNKRDIRDWERAYKDMASLKLKQDGFAPKIESIKPDKPFLKDRRVNEAFINLMSDHSVDYDYYNRLRDLLGQSTAVAKSRDGNKLRIFIKRSDVINTGYEYYIDAIKTDPKSTFSWKFDIEHNHLGGDFEYDYALPFSDGGLLNRLSTHYNGDTEKIRELISKVRAKQLV